MPSYSATNSHCLRTRVGWCPIHMRTSTLLLFVLYFFSSFLWAQSKGNGPVDYSDQAFVTERYSESFRFENDGTGREQIDSRIKVNSDAGVQALGQLKVGYSSLSDKLEIPYVRVIKPDGTIVNAQESAIQDVTYLNALMYSDYHEKHISVPSLRPG